MEPAFRHDVRAIIVRGGRVLTCTLIGRHSFYPGGGVEMEERATEALLRELREELGVSARIRGFLGAYQWVWRDEQEGLHHFLSHFFEVEAEELDPAADPVSREPHLRFQWATPEELVAWPVYPEAVHQVVRALLKGERRTWWFSEVRGEVERL